MKVKAKAKARNGRESLKRSKGGTSFSCFLIGSGTLLWECANILRSQNHTILGVITSTARERPWAEQRDLRVAEEILGGLVAGLEEQDAVRHEFGVREALAVGFGLEE